MNWLGQNWSQVFSLGWRHLQIAVPAIFFALLLAVIFGWLAHRYRQVHGPLLGVLGIMYAVPSLPLLIAVPALIGTGLRSPVNMVLVLTFYGVAVMVRQVSDGFDSVPKDALISAEACGFSSWQRFWKVELPLAIPVITAGLRVVVVSTISLVTVGAVIGIQSLGTLFTDGFQRGLVAEVVTGLAAVVVLALLLDALVVMGSALLTPWTRTSRRERTPA